MDAGVYLLDKAISSRDEARIQESLGLVKHMAERIRKITLDVLFYAKERELNRSRVNLRQFAAEVADTVTPRFVRLGIRLVCNMEAVRVRWKWIQGCSKRPWSIFWRMPWMPVWPTPRAKTNTVCC